MQVVTRKEFNFCSVVHDGQRFVVFGYDRQKKRGFGRATLLGVEPGTGVVAHRHLSPNICLRYVFVTPIRTRAGRPPAHGMFLAAHPDMCRRVYRLLHNFDFVPTAHRGGPVFVDGDFKCGRLERRGDTLLVAGRLDYGLIANITRFVGRHAEGPAATNLGNQITAVTPYASCRVTIPDEILGQAALSADGTTAAALSLTGNAMYIIDLDL